MKSQTPAFRRSCPNLFTSISVLTSVSLGMCLTAMATPYTHHIPVQTSTAAVVGTWTGTSRCVGNRPTCKNETVVYRFIAVDGHPNQLRLLADKIIDGVRVPMGALVFEYDEAARELRGEFRRDQTHLLWTFKVTGDSMTGTLLVLPERSIGRDVNVHRVKDTDVPAAPAISEYDN
jgi:hypothetical protein